MPTSTMTSKGQITLPREVREALGLATGDRVDFVRTEAGFALVPLRGEVRRLEGRFAGRDLESLSVEQMDRVIGEAAAERNRH
ncbi:MAG: AbrB/MazE/SpoVT family DNA-binding domain-containing protein [Pseudomonadota bacterium]